MLFGKREKATGRKRIKRILIVEDEPLVAFDNEHLLADAGFDVVATVDSVADAVRVIGAESLDLVMTDVALNGVGDGTDVARAAAGEGVPVLFVTGNFPEEARSLGVGCLAKPYPPRALLSAISAIDAQMDGRPRKKLPRGFRLFGEASA